MVAVAYLIHHTGRMQTRETAVTLTQINTHLHALTNALILYAYLQAAFEGRTEIARYLIQHKANVNTRNRMHRTPVFCAVERNHLEVIKLLFEKKADVRCKDINGATILQYASGGTFDCFVYALVYERALIFRITSFFSFFPYSLFHSLVLFSPNSRRTDTDVFDMCAYMDARVCVRARSAQVCMYTLIHVQKQSEEERNTHFQHVRTTRGYRIFKKKYRSELHETRSTRT
jgi:hypothetical protein